MDNLLNASKNPKGLVDILTSKHNLKLKCTGPTPFRLGCDFGQDDDGTLHFVPLKQTEKIIDCHVNMFGSKPKLNEILPLDKSDHPKLDTSEYLDKDGAQKYQSLIGAIQWEASLCGLDTDTSVMNKASFRNEPRQGHLDRAKRVISYLFIFKQSTIRIRTEELDLSSILVSPYDWEE